MKIKTDEQKDYFSPNHLCFSLIFSKTKGGGGESILINKFMIKIKSYLQKNTHYIRSTQPFAAFQPSPLASLYLYPYPLLLLNPGPSLSFPTGRTREGKGLCLPLKGEGKERRMRGGPALCLYPPSSFGLTKKPYPSPREAGKGYYSNHDINKQLTNFLKNYKFLKNQNLNKKNLLAGEIGSITERSEAQKFGMGLPLKGVFHGSNLITQRVKTAVVTPSDVPSKAGNAAGTPSNPLNSGGYASTFNHIKTKTRNYLFLQTILSKNIDSLSLAYPGGVTLLKVMRLLVPLKSPLLHTLSFPLKGKGKGMSKNISPKGYPKVFPSPFGGRHKPTGERGKEKISLLKSMSLNSIKKGALVQNGKYQDVSNYFLLSKITNKSFLCYWLLPVIGLAFISKGQGGFTPTMPYFLPVYASPFKGVGTAGSGTKSNSNSFTGTTTSSPYMGKEELFSFLNNLRHAYPYGVSPSLWYPFGVSTNEVIPFGTVNTSYLQSLPRVKGYLPLLSPMGLSLPPKGEGLGLKPLPLVLPYGKEREGPGYGYKQRGKVFPFPYLWLGPGEKKEGVSIAPPDWSAFPPLVGKKSAPPLGGSAITNFKIIPIQSQIVLNKNLDFVSFNRLIGQSQMTGPFYGSALGAQPEGTVRDRKGYAIKDFDRATLLQLASQKWVDSLPHLGFSPSNNGKAGTALNLVTSSIKNITLAEQDNDQAGLLNKFSNIIKLYFRSLSNLNNTNTKGFSPKNSDKLVQLPLKRKNTSHFYLPPPSYSPRTAQVKTKGEGKESRGTDQQLKALPFDLSNPNKAFLLNFIESTALRNKAEFNYIMVFNLGKSWDKGQKQEALANKSINIREFFIKPNFNKDALRFLFLNTLPSGYKIQNTVLYKAIPAVAGTPSQRSSLLPGTKWLSFPLVLPYGKERGMQGSALSTNPLTQHFRNPLLISKAKVCTSTPIFTGTIKKFASVQPSFYFNYINKKLKKFILTSPSTLTFFPLSIPLRGIPKVSNNGKEAALMPDPQRGKKKGDSPFKAYLNRSNPSISILFKHKKMFKKNYNQLNLGLNLGEQTKSQQIIDSRLYFQKKRKAKKQRLETRRQKKRTRLFPRPTWIRFRMFSDFLHNPQRGKKSDGNLKPYPSQSLPGPSLVGTVNTSYLQSQREGKVFPIGERKRLGFSSSNNGTSFLEKQVSFGNKQIYSGLNPPSLTQLGQTKSWVKSSPLFLFRDTLSLPLVRTKDKGPFALLKKKSSPFFLEVPKGKPKEKKSIKIQKIKETKLKANYINFKSQKQNNQANQATTNSISTMFRDFWIWVYNITANNKYNQFIFSKNQTPLCWALNKTFNKYSFTQYNKRYNLWGSQKIRNQSKNNKTVLMSKQLVTYWDRFFLNPNLNLFNKKIYAKMRNSLQKVTYLNSTEIKPLSTNVTGNNEKGHVKNRQNSGNYYKYNLLVNLPWWHELNINPFKESIKLVNNVQSSYPLGGRALVFTPKYEGAQVKTEGVTNEVIPFGTVNKKYLQSLPRVKGPNMDTVPAKLRKQKVGLVIGSTILFHFCALISLISISQVRCFLKFHFILVYKISNLYSLLITQISLINRKFVQASSLFLIDGEKHKPPISQRLPNPYGVSTSQAGTYPVGVKGNAYYDSQRESQLRSSCVLPYGKERGSPDQPKLQLSLSLNLVHKQFVPLWAYAYPQRGKGTPLDTLWYPFPSLREGPGVSKVKDLIDKQSNNSVKGWLGVLLPMPSKKLKINYKKAYSSKNYLSYKINLMVYHLKKDINTLAFGTKNVCLKSIFKIIDLVQSALRSISAFFEKPAEFTTSWIAYGFLVEWSSDFLAIIPENADIYMWNTFSKASRILPIANLSFFAQKILVQLPSTLSFFTISHLLQLRMAYLFDTLIKTVSQPDADLIRRQQKGTLFWDLWADFLVTAADQYNVNIAALSTIKAEQNNLIENISNGFYLKAEKNMAFNSFPSPFVFTPLLSPTGKVLNEGGGRHKPFPSLWEGPGEQSRKALMIGVAPPLLTPEGGILFYLDTPPSFSPSPSLVGQNTPQKNGKQTVVTKVNMDGLFNEGLIKKSVIRKKSKLGNNSLIKSEIPWDNLATTNRWAVNQFITYQSWNNNSDLFIDYHPPKSFTHIPILKYNTTIQQPIGTLVCQIYAGIFNKQISKNILLVNNKNDAKKQSSFHKKGKSTSNIESSVNSNALLIQALAGETELKMITDNAKRYALVNRGFAIGIKLLRDVFDKIKLTTPCIFLLEDIHAIGERRPMLISDYGGDDTKTNNELFMSQLDEVHEKNQVIYQNFFHAITHYKKPFKGDYSNAIPTNKYLTDLYRFLRSQGTNNLSLTVNNNTTLKPKIESSHANKEASLQNKKASSFSSPLGGKATHLQLPTDQSQLTPPSTSPFNVLLLKSSPKDLQNKVVQEFPWPGLPGEQLSTKPRISYSVRAKVSMLAELSLSNLSAKLDMITDLLVIIDSVRGNKGFVVFATTDVPHVLDPALRRPGRLDETICMPNISNTSVLSGNARYEIFKSVNKIDSKYNYQDSLQVSPLINKLTINLNDSSSYCANASLNYALLSKSMFLLTTTNPLISKMMQKNKTIGKTQKLIPLIRGNIPLLKLKLHAQQALAYYEVSKAVLNFKIQITSSVNTFNTLTQTFKSGGSSQSAAHINYLAMFGEGPYVHLSQQIMLLFAGKIGQNLAAHSPWSFPTGRKGVSKKLPVLAQAFNLNNLKEKRAISPSINKKNERAQPKGSSSQAKSERNREAESNYAIEDQDLQLATTLMLAFIQKRYLYNKNLIVPKLLSFLDGQVLDEPPSPPFSNLLIPAKRFENYKRVFRDSIFADNIGVYTNRKTIDYYEKMHDQIQLSSIKKLGSLNRSTVKSNAGNTPKRDVSETGTNNHLVTSTYNLETNFLKKLYHLKSLQTSTNINWYYQNRILKRHSQYLINQWWNGQLSEHNAETVFLSDIDWRSSFIKSSNMKKPEQKNKGQDVLLDFPDADQIYNPRRRRWLLNKGYWSFWFNFDKIYSEQLVHHLVLESVIKTYTYLYNNGELLDFITAKFMTLGSAKHDLLSPTGINASATMNFIQTQYNAKNFSIDHAVIPLCSEIHLTHSFTRF